MQSDCVVERYIAKEAIDTGGERGSRIGLQREGGAAARIMSGLQKIAMSFFAERVAR